MRICKTKIFTTFWKCEFNNIASWQQISKFVVSIRRSSGNRLNFIAIYVDYCTISILFNKLYFCTNYARLPLILNTIMVSIKPHASTQRCRNNDFNRNCANFAAIAARIRCNSLLNLVNNWRIFQSTIWIIIITI